MLRVSGASASIDAMLYLAAHQAIQVADAKLTHWLTASGGLGAFTATAVLARVAVRFGRLEFMPSTLYNSSATIRG